MSDYTLIQIDQLPGGTPNPDSPFMFGIGSQIYTVPFSYILSQIPAVDPNVRPRLQDQNITVLEDDLQTFLNTVNVTIAAGEIVILRFSVIYNNGLVTLNSYMIPLSTGSYTPLGQTLDFNQLILIEKEIVGAGGTANTIVYTSPSLVALNNADPAFDLSDNTKEYIIILDNLPFLFIGTNGFYGLGELQMVMGDLQALTTPSSNLTSLKRQEFTYSGGAQTFGLSETPSAIYAVFVQGQELNASQYSISSNNLTIIDDLNTGEFVNIIYSGLPVGLDASYTKIEIDEFLLNKQNIRIIKTASFVAENGQNYTANGTLTVTDPTPEDNDGYVVFVVAGPVTINAMVYNAGALVYRFYNGTTWLTAYINAGGGGGAVDSVNGQTGTVVLTASDVGAEPALGFTPENTTNKSGTLTASTTLYPNNDAVLAGLAGKKNLLDSRVTASITGTYNLDWSAGEVFVLTVTGAVIISDINLPSGTNSKVIELIINGNFAVTLPGYWDALPSNDAYSGTVRNHLVVSCINGTTGSEDVIYSLENL